MPDPKLQQVAEEVKVILNKAGVSGVLFIASETHGEYLYHLKTPYNGINEVPGGVHFNIMKKDFPTEEAWNKCLRLSCGEIAYYHDMGLKMTRDFEGLLRKLSQYLDIEHISKSETNNQN